MSQVHDTFAVRREAAAQGATEIAERPGHWSVRPEAEKIIVIDDEYLTRTGLCGLLQDAGWEVEAYCACEDFLAANRSRPGACIVLDMHFPGMGGLDLLRRLEDLAGSPPIIVVSGSSNIAEAVQSMRRGALDFIEKPVAGAVLVASVERALARSRRSDRIAAARSAATARLAGLTARQHQVLAMVLAGSPSKNIAADLGISQRTVENHRAAIMRRTGAGSLPALAQLVMRTDGPDAPDSGEPAARPRLSGSELGS